MLAKNQLTINQPINGISSADGENVNQAKSPPIVNISDDDQGRTLFMFCFICKIILIFNFFLIKELCLFILLLTPIYKMHFFL